MKVLVTGAGGLIGYESSKFFLGLSAEVTGIDNNMRKYFFGDSGDVSGNIENLISTGRAFNNLGADIRSRDAVLGIFRERGPFDLVIHTAAQPSHDWAAKEPFTDFDINAVGTLNLLEAFRLYSPRSVFIFVSTNKVYGDTPNKAALIELEDRYDYADDQEIEGISTKGVSERLTIDDSTHSLFGASKAAADLIAQEYGRYFGLNVGIFRGGCLTGPQHSAVELHGFLTYIVDCAVKNRPYTIFGCKGKQVRDQIHSRDVVSAFHEFYKKPGKGVVYNIGGCKQNAASILEIIAILKRDFGLKLDHTYVDQARTGDHICYYSDMAKFKKDYPRWSIQNTLRDIVEEIIASR
ncbi:MAG: NAD-dependent epimerase/dehydratase family protein [Candidatus Omnitrophica bacterium]|nr:NAD-dependent epimerase/dehydratase family protein [Candidatus Omnitrophota bacterium]MBU1128208.1 NAD-dependent epimerase/dehydratase family protein [Candidatus Omnitrophota bacterium]MBU1851671.1 NAD-dependent epimerase/dehydratase family protein [Candidatus Omnitrophota bacterium]